MNKRQKKKQITMIKRRRDKIAKRYWGGCQPPTIYIPVDDDMIELCRSMHLIGPNDIVVDQYMNPFIKIDLSFDSNNSKGFNPLIG